jgi:Zn-dependent protease with chaperone function
MHVLLILLSLLLVTLGGYAALGVIRRAEDWRQRRRLALLVLAAPAISLGAGIIGLHHFLGRICFLTAPPWDEMLSTAGPAAMAAVVLGALGWGLLRFGLVPWTLTRRTIPAASDLRAIADRLARQLGVPRPRVRVCLSPRPIAISWGVRRPALLLSTWMLDRLDVHELEAVIAHELGHAARRDALVVWLATVLRDAFFYLPTSRWAYERLQADKELAADELAAGVTGRPLALASALAKVWQGALGDPTLGAAQSFAAESTWIEQRIERLVEGRVQQPPATRSSASVVSLGALAVVGCLTLQAAGLVAMFLDPMACGPASPLWRLFQG